MHILVELLNVLIGGRSNSIIRDDACNPSAENVWRGSSYGPVVRASSKQSVTPRSGNLAAGSELTAGPGTIMASDKLWHHLVSQTRL